MAVEPPGRGWRVLCAPGLNASTEQMHWKEIKPGNNWELKQFTRRDFPITEGGKGKC